MPSPTTVVANSLSFGELGLASSQTLVAPLEKSALPQPDRRVVCCNPQDHHFQLSWKIRALRSGHHHSNRIMEAQSQGGNPDVSWTERIGSQNSTGRQACLQPC